MRAAEASVAPVAKAPFAHALCVASFDRRFYWMSIATALGPVSWNNAPGGHRWMAHGKRHSDFRPGCRRSEKQL